MSAEVKERARPYFEDASPAHDWHHVRRVARLAETLVDEQDVEVDEDVLFAAVWLHDIGRAKEDRGEIADHAEWGASEAGRILRDLDVDGDTVAAVQHCVRAHRYSNDVDPETPEGNSSATPTTSTRWARSGSRASSVTAGNSANPSTTPSARRKRTTPSRARRS